MSLFRETFERDGEPLPVAVDHVEGDRYRVRLGDALYELTALPSPDGGVWLDLGDGGVEARCVRVGRRLQVRVAGRTWQLEPHRRGSEVSRERDGVVVAPMTGTVTEVLVERGDRVDAGQAVLLLTAMKMEHSLEAGSSGIVVEVRVADGETVEQGAVVIRIDDSPDGPGT